MRVLFFLLIAQAVTGQVIPQKWVGFIQPSGDTSDIVILQDLPATIYYRIVGDTTMRKRTAIKANPLLVYRPLYEVPMPLGANGRYAYSEVIQSPGLKKEELYKHARVWFAEFFNDSKSVLEMAEREDGVLIGTGWSKIQGGKFWYSIKIEVRDERYKYTITDMEIQSDPITYNPVPAKISLEVMLSNERRSRSLKEVVILKLQDICSSLQKVVRTPQTKDDW